MIHLELLQVWRTMQDNSSRPASAASSPAVHAGNQGSVIPASTASLLLLPPVHELEQYVLQDARTQSTQGGESAENLVHILPGLWTFLLCFFPCFKPRLIWIRFNRGDWRLRATLSRTSWFRLVAAEAHFEGYSTSQQITWFAFLLFKCWICFIFG